MTRQCIGVVLGMMVVGLFAPGALAVSSAAGGYLKQPDGWFRTPEALQVARNVISWQNPDGGWAKGARADREHQPGTPWGEWQGVGTIDNGYTISEIRLLARIHRATGDQELVPAIDNGIDYLLRAQYPNGGWPQRFPPPDNYGRNITFNDDAMVNVLRLMREIATSPEFAFVGADRRAAAQRAFDKGIGCILDAQIKVDGKLTAWCAQYDPQTLAPAQGRAYELPSISGGESAKIVMLLMDLDHPSARVRKAIEAAVAWFDAVKITGVRLERRPVGAGGAMELVEVRDPDAPPLWARFYDLKTQKPMFVNRNGKVVWSFMELEPEPRAGYAWLRKWGRAVLDRYPAWEAAHGGDTSSRAMQ